MDWWLDLTDPDPSYFTSYLRQCRHSAYSESVECRPLANAGKVSAAELTVRKRQFFSYRTLAYFSILWYCIKTNFFKRLYGATFPLPNGVSCAPLRLIVKAMGPPNRTTNNPPSVVTRPSRGGGFTNVRADCCIQMWGAGPYSLSHFFQYSTVRCFV